MITLATLIMTLSNSLLIGVGKLFFSTERPNISYISQKELLLS